MHSRFVINSLIYVEQQLKAKNVTSKSIVQVVIFHVLSFTCVNNSFRSIFIFVENNKKERTQMAWRMSMGSFSQTVEWIIILFIYWNVLIAPSKPDAFFALYTYLEFICEMFLIWILFMPTCSCHFHFFGAYFEC